MIYLVDHNQCQFGHSVIYRNALLKIDQTVPVCLKLKELPQNGSKLLLLLSRIINWIRQVKVIDNRGGVIVHILYGDLYYGIPFVRRLGKSKQKFVITMHSCPEGKTKRKFIRNYLSKADKVIVHSEYNLEQLKSLGLHNIVKIDYPTFYDYTILDNRNMLREKRGVNKGDLVLGALGSIRDDKGLDILLEAFKFIPSTIKENIILNIAGSPGFLHENEIVAKCKEYGIRNILTVRGLTDKEFMENVVICDYMVMPYRKRMTANSGPMTEAIVNSIPCIVPDYGNIADIARKYNVGVCFKSEDSRSLAETIISEYEHPSKFSFEYGKQLTIDNFIKQHIELYKSIKNE